MTTAEAIATLRAAGRVETAGGRIRCLLPRRRPPEVELALSVVRERKPEALEVLEKGTLEAVLKGHAIALYCDLVKQTLWLVADGEDAARLGERRGLVYTADEIRLVAAIDDPKIVKEVHHFKDVFNVPIRGPDC